MKRKRFIKLLMGKHSCSKREAEDCTYYALSLYGSYSCAYSHIASMYSDGDNVLEILLMEWMEKAMKECAKQGAKVSEALSCIAEAFKFVSENIMWGFYL